MPLPPRHEKAVTRRHRTGWLCAVVCALAALAAAETGAPDVVEIYWQASRTISVPGVSQVVVVDESICRAEISGEQVHLFGLARGETVAFAWVAGQRIAFRINVVQPPAILPPPRLLDGALQNSGYGTMGSSTQYFSDSSGNARVFLQHQFSWDQNSGQEYLSIRAQANDALAQAGAPGFNLAAGSVQYGRPGLAVSVIDFALHVNGAGHDSIAPLPNSNTVVLRGADVLLQSGANSYEMFAGATPSYYYLSLTGTKDVAGFTFSHKQSDRLELYSTVALVNAPPVLQLSKQRQMSAFDTTGFLFRPAEHLLVQASAGLSTEGGMAQSAVTYVASGLSAFVAGSTMSSEFPLNRLQMFSATKASLMSGVRYTFTPRVDGGLNYQRTSGSTVLLQSPSVSSDFLNPNLSVRLTPHHALTFNYVHSEARGSLLASQDGNRVDVDLNSQIAGRASNTVQVDVGQLRDPLQLQTASNLSVRDSVSVPFKGQSLWVSFQQQHTAKPLPSLLNDELSLLSPALQQLFLQDPIAFVNSPNLPPDVLALLRSLQPTETEAWLYLQLHLSKKLEFRPSFQYQRSALSTQQQFSNKGFGYALVYQASPSLQVQSSLTNTFMYNSIASQFQRTTVFTVGGQKSFRASPANVLPSRRWHAIQGRVFRDVNVNGAFNEGEPGLAGLRVELDQSRVTLTDAQGRYEFARVPSGRHTVRLPLDQFTHTVRVTTPTPVEVELIDRKTVEADFGLVDFARLMGTVYNDYTMSNSRTADAPGLRGVQLALRGGSLHRVATADSAGEFEFDDLPPGDYTLTVDAATVPPNSIVQSDFMEVHLGPTSTVITDIPLRALRSISGHVYLKAEARSPKPSRQKKAELQSAAQSVRGPGLGETGSTVTVLRPLPGIRIVAGASAATTDAEGGFVLRNLPSGDIDVQIVPTSDLPAGMTAPSGRVHMPRDPLSVEGASIVISNPELLRYLAPEPDHPSSPPRP